MPSVRTPAKTKLSSFGCKIQNVATGTGLDRIFPFVEIVFLCISPASFQPGKMRACMGKSWGIGYMKAPPHKLFDTGAAKSIPKSNLLCSGGVCFVHLGQNGIDPNAWYKSH